MPKSIIREFDNSNSGSTILAAEFAVAIPGYAAIDLSTNTPLRDEAIANGIICDPLNPDILKLSSKAQFIRYVGKFNASSLSQREVAPVPEEIVKTSTSKLAKELHTLTQKDYVDADDPSRLAAGYKFYKVDAENDKLPTTDSRWNHNGYLLISYTAAQQDNPDQAVTKTFDLNEKEVTIDDIGKDYDTTAGHTTHTYFKIPVESLGTSARKVQHLGNRMAFELLGLGYPVYYRVIKQRNAEGQEIGLIEQLNKEDFWDPFKNKVIYPIRYLSAGGIYEADINKRMLEVAQFLSGDESQKTIAELDVMDREGKTPNGRGDCIALLDIAEEKYDATTDKYISVIDGSTQKKLVKSVADQITALGIGTLNGKYAAIFAPRVVYDLEEDPDKIYPADDKFPASFHYLACAASAFTRYSEWYAVAGYSRGVSPLPIKYTTYTFGEIAINTLAPRIPNTFTDVAVNLILNERGNHYLWGNRTALKIEEDKGLQFSHFLNIRQLCSTIKKTIYKASRTFTFNPNSDLLWINFVEAIKPTLERMVSDQGIQGYKITKVATSEKALLKANIRIVPIEAIEDFDISLFLENSLSGVTVTADESVAE